MGRMRRKKNRKFNPLTTRLLLLLSRVRVVLICFGRFSLLFFFSLVERTHTCMWEAHSHRARALSSHQYNHVIRTLMHSYTLFEGYSFAG